ncbi:MAG: hypothetical protein ACHQFX_14460 [Chitinophagales bacterium]
MKTFKIVSLLSLFMALGIISFAQSKTETIPVSGNCGMCKTTIEKAAKKAGATTATWNKETKVIVVKYNSSTTNAGKIQEGIAASGYDTRDFKATNESYTKLPACCQYDRTAAKESCCGDKCEMKDGKCVNMETCKENGCCKDEASCKANGCCSASTGKDGMECCKDGKCTKPGHDGKDCCKKS